MALLRRFSRLPNPGMQGCGCSMHRPATSIRVPPWLRAKREPVPETGEVRQYLVVRTALGAGAIVPVTVENGTFNLHYGAGKIGKGRQLPVDSDDSPTLASSGLHSPEELAPTRSIIGKPVREITRPARPGMASGPGFLAADEDILSVLDAGNEPVRRLGLKHPDLARPLFHAWNLLLSEYELGRLGRFKEDVVSFRYNRREIRLRSQQRPKVSRSPFSTTKSRGFRHRTLAEIGRQRAATSRRCVCPFEPGRPRGHDTTPDPLAHGRNGCVLHYIIRYGFYEGHTDYRAEPDSARMYLRPEDPVGNRNGLQRGDRPGADEAFHSKAPASAFTTP